MNSEKTTCNESVIFHDFQNPGTNAKSMFRWWFPDASADLEKVRNQIYEMYNGGFSGVEVAFSPQFTDFDPNGKYAWGTDRWREIIKTILKTALELPGGFKVDFHVTPHWPQTINTICPNDDVQAQELIGAFEKLTGDGRGCRRIPMPPIKTNDGDAGDAADYIFENKFVAMTIAQVAKVEGDNYTLVWDTMQDVSSLAKVETDPDTGEVLFTSAGIPLHEEKFGDMPKLRDRQFYYVADREKLPVSDNNDEEIREGDWLLFGLWRRGSGQSVSGRFFEIFSLGLPFGPKCYTIDCWDPKGPSLLQDYWEDNILCDPEIVEMLREIGSTTDSCFKSFCTLGAETIGVWAESFPEDFRNCNGYSIIPYLPLIAFHDFKIQFGPYQFRYLMTADNENGERLLEDFYKTAIWINMNRCDKEYTDWARKYNYQIREKNYAPTKEASWSSMAIDQSEGATLDLRMKMDNFRDIASGIHVAGKNIMAAEANADELMPYRLTFKNVCEKLNICYAAGLNLAIFHGASFDEESSGKFSQWPGWHCFQFLFSGAWGRRHPWWPGIHYLSDYLARTQSVLQSGTAKMDLLVYEALRNSDEIWNGAAKDGEYKKLISRGYTYDIGGDAVITSPGCALENGRLGVEGPAYKALIIRPGKFTTLPALEQMIKLADSGFPVISVGTLPVRVRGLEVRGIVSDQMICDAVERLESCKGFYHVEDEDGLLDKLEELDVLPDLQYCDPYTYNIQRDDGKSRWFYIYNSGKEETVISVNPGSGRSAYVADPWSGNLYSINGNKIVLPACASRFIVYAISDFYPDELPEYTVPGKVIEELDQFSLVIDSWGPGNDAKDPCLSRHTLLNMGNIELKYWDEMEAPETELAADGCGSMYHVSGIGRYITSYLSEEKKEVFLVTESGEDQIIRIAVNGKVQPVPDAVARYSEIELDEGENQIEIELASTLRRRVNLENPFFTENDFEIMFGNIENYGNASLSDPKKMNRYGLTSVKICEKL